MFYYDSLWSWSGLPSTLIDRCTWYRYFVFPSQYFLLFIILNRCGTCTYYTCAVISDYYIFCFFLFYFFVFLYNFFSFISEKFLNVSFIWQFLIGCVDYRMANVQFCNYRQVIVMCVCVVLCVCCLCTRVPSRV